LTAGASLSIAELRALAGIAVRAAREGAALVSRGWRTHPAAEHKRHAELVTRFDRESEDLLRASLAKETAFPFVGEETGASLNAREHASADTPTWFVDPLDGTTNFVHGHPFYCVSIGLLAGGRPLVGAVVAPAVRIEWIGVVGDSATRNGERCVVSEVERIEDALLATGFPYDRRSSAENNFDAFVAIKQKSQAVRRCGSAAMDLCLVGDGTYDGYWERKLKPWDLAAGSAIVLAAGGRLSSFDGGAPELATGHLVASNGRIHDAIVSTLTAVASTAR
jgi:myo-inositol-1(or 4)-monophosphatase